MKIRKKLDYALKHPVKNYKINIYKKYNLNIKKILWINKINLNELKSSIIPNDTNINNYNLDIYAGIPILLHSSEKILVSNY